MVFTIAFLLFIKPPPKPKSNPTFNLFSVVAHHLRTMKVFGAGANGPNATFKMVY
jgi:hypothetical protein